MPTAPGPLTDGDAPPARPAGPSGPLRHQPSVLVFIAVLLTLGALKLSAPVTLPLAFALFLVGLLWPLQRRLQRVMPRSLALAVNLLVLLLFASAFVGLLWLCAEQVSDHWAPYQEQLSQQFEQARQWASAQGIPLPSGAGGGNGAVGSLAERVAGAVFSATGGAVLVIAFFVLAMLEVPTFTRKVRRVASDHAEDWPASGYKAAVQFSRYFGVRTLVGAVTGVGTGLFCFVVGLDFALIWGVTNFLLNYIPTLGSIIGIVPPTLFALVQFGPVGALGVLAGVGGVQLFMGQFVDPLFEGYALNLSALVVLLAVAFWGWMWGVAGALIGVPITVAVAVGCRQTDRYQWVADFLAGRLEEAE